MLKRKRSVDQLHRQEFLERAHKLGIRLIDISGGQTDLTGRLALPQFDDERIKPQIRETEKVLRGRRNETIKLVLYAVAGLAAGVTIMTVIAKALGR